MKETYFFTHDYNARQDPKMQEVLMDMGVAGLGIYWCVVEQLYEQGGQMPLSAIKAIAFTLHAPIEDVRKLIESYGLFDNDGEMFWSHAVSRRLESRRGVTEKRAKAAAKRWEKNANASKPDANAMQMHSETDANAMHEKNCAMQKSENETFCNTIKEKKIKEKEIKENSLCVTPACASEEERERFLEIFTLVLNFNNPQQEVERFVSHYDASGWCRKDSTVPVKNKEALAKMWTPQVAGAKYPEEFRQWLFETYGKAKASDAIAAACLLREVYRVQMFDQSGTKQVRVECSHGAAQAIEKYYSRRPAWKMSYRIPN